jgi:hypothetical protein
MTKPRIALSLSKPETKVAVTHFDATFAPLGPCPPQGSLNRREHLDLPLGFVSCISLWQPIGTQTRRAILQYPSPMSRARAIVNDGYCGFFTEEQDTEAQSWDAIQDHLGTGSGTGDQELTSVVDQ